MKQKKSPSTRRPSWRKVKIDYFWKKIVLGLYISVLLISGAFIFGFFSDFFVAKPAPSNDFFISSSAETASTELVPTVPRGFSESEQVVANRPTKLSFDFAAATESDQYQIAIVAAAAEEAEEAVYSIPARSTAGTSATQAGSIEYRYYDAAGTGESFPGRLELTVRDLEPTTHYEFVFSRRAANELEYTEIHRGEAFTSPRAPKRLEIDTGVTDDRFFELSWTVDEASEQRIIGYNVYFREEIKGIDSASAPDDLSAWNRLSFTNNRVRIRRFFEIGKRYEFLVRAIGPDGSESPIDEKAFHWARLPEMKILIVDEGTHAANVLRVILGDYRPAALTAHDSLPENWAAASSQERVYLGMASSTREILDVNNNWVVGSALDETYDIVNLSFSTYQYASAESFFQALQARYSARESKPIFVFSAGNEKTICTNEAYEYAKREGSFPTEEKRYRDLDRAGQQEVFFRACNLLPAYIAREHPNFMENVIVAGGNVVVPGSVSGMQLPGSVLKNHWISTYYEFQWEDGQNRKMGLYPGVSRIAGTSFSAPYVARAIASIKRRLPFLSNRQILDIIYETALPEAEGEIWGRGILSPGNIQRRVDEIQEQIRGGL